MTECSLFTLLIIVFVSISKYSLLRSLFGYIGFRILFLQKGDSIEIRTYLSEMGKSLFLSQKNQI